MYMADMADGRARRSQPALNPDTTSHLQLQAPSRGAHMLCFYVCSYAIPYMHGSRVGSGTPGWAAALGCRSGNE